MQGRLTGNSTCVSCSDYDKVVLQVCVPQRMSELPDQHDGVVSIATGSSFSAVLTEHGSVYYTGRLGGQPEGEGREGGPWKLLYNKKQSKAKVTNIRGGLHYLAAVEQGEGRHRLLLWGRHHNSQIHLSTQPTEVYVVHVAEDVHIREMSSFQKVILSLQFELPSSLIDWDAGPMDLCMLLR